MSYCRWSSDDYQCDVYTYEDVGGGFTTHVAGRRHVFRKPLPEPIEWVMERNIEWMERHAKVMRMVELAKLEPIGLSEDGCSYNDPDAARAADRLQWLKDMGYRVPQYAIDALRKEAAQQQMHAEGSAKNHGLEV